MRKNVSLMTRTLVMALVAMGLFGMGGTSASAQSGEVCKIEPKLELADQNGDGLVTIAEIDRVIRLSGDNADLQAARDQAVAAGVTGIRYVGCDPDAGTADTTDGTADTTDGTADTTDGTADTTDGTADTTDGTADATDGTADATDGTADTTDGTADATDGTADATDGTADGTGDGSGDVTELPETGVGASTTQDHTMAYVVGTGSMLLLAGAYMFRLSRKA